PEHPEGRPLLMSGTATVKAVTNGTTVNKENQTELDLKKRPSGLVHVFEEQIYHVTSLGASALGEAERLLRTIQQDASYLERVDAREGLDVASVTVNLGESLDCIDTAIEHLSALNVAIRSRLDQDCNVSSMF